MDRTTRKDDAPCAPRHRALIVEDESLWSEKFKAVVESLGHEHVHVTTLEEAAPLVETGDFCYVILDLTIKPRQSSTQSDDSAGHAVLRHLRKHFPGHNDLEKHALQVLVVTNLGEVGGHVKPTYEAGADTIIKKGSTGLSEEIEKALERSERREHARCAEVMRSVARGRVRGREDSIPPNRLDVPGRRVKKRTIVRLGGAQVALPPAEFLALLQLIAARLSGKLWVTKTVLGDGDPALGHTRVHRLTNEIKKQLKLKSVELLTNRIGEYRLADVIELRHVDWTLLAEDQGEDVIRFVTKTRRELGIR